ncbi:acyltransferase [bacterium]|nr:acyltransferase [bacterium]MCI0604644.1 acyltransferase [bacterium]
MRSFHSHGSGKIDRSKFKSIGENVIFEEGVLVFHPENIAIGSNVYVGHYSILKGYYQNDMVIQDDVWIGQFCFFHSAGGLIIGARVGIGPSVRIITSYHQDEGRYKSLLEGEIIFAEVQIGEDSDIGTNATILPGVTVGKGVQIGAGAVVHTSIPDYTIAAGVPARVLRERLQ